MTQKILEEFVALYKEADGWYDDIEGVEVIDDGDFVDEGKYQYSTSIVEFKDTLIQINKSRSGSHYTDWYYNDTEIFVVTRHEKVEIIYTYHQVGNIATVSED